MKDNYQKDLQKRQQEHLNSIQERIYDVPCMHDNCPSCVGTGIKSDGSLCFHHLSCNCPKCSFR